MVEAIESRKPIRLDDEVSEEVASPAEIAITLHTIWRTAALSQPASP